MNGKIDSQENNSLSSEPQCLIGITGGIGSGKSTVESFIKAITSIPILDADIYAREALRPQSVSFEAITNRYGKTILIENENGYLINRTKLAKILFNDKKEKEWIEKLIHPIVKERINEELNYVKEYPVVILVVPLLFESSLNKLCTEVWVVSCTIEQQYQRIMKRDGINNEEAKKRIEAQWPISQKVKLANLIIDNSKNNKDWEAEIENHLRKINPQVFL